MFSLPVDWPRYAALAAATAAVVPILLFSKMIVRRKLSRWAQGEGMTLVDFRGAAFYEGPGRFARSDNQSVYRVEVRDRSGAIRSAWVTSGTYWGFPLGDEITDVAWDSER